MNVTLASSYMLFHTFGPFFWTSRDGISVTNLNHLFGQIGTEKLLTQKRNHFNVHFSTNWFQPKNWNQWITIWLQRMYETLERCNIRLFFWLTYIILFTSLQKRVGCIGMFFELQFNCIDLWPLLLLVAASAISCGS